MEFCSCKNIPNHTDVKQMHQLIP